MEDSRSPYAVEQWGDIPIGNFMMRKAKKYNFSLFDFALAKKETHVQKLLEVYDAHRENVHDSWYRNRT